MKKITLQIIFFFILVSSNIKCLEAQPYADQLYKITNADSLLYYSESVTNLKIADDGVSLTLTDNVLKGEYILQPQSFDEPFNLGLPSWNGKSPAKENSSLKFFLRFEIDGTWQQWVTVGYWDNYIWNSYGNINFTWGKVDIDYVKLNQYITKFQFKVVFERKSSSYPSPLLRQLSFSVSDTQTPVNIDDIIADKPEAITINTTHYYQYGLDPDIGGDICSPTSVSMMLKSYGITVNPVEFANRTYDSYWEIFGVWPRVVAHASEYGLDGVVNRYRTWSEAAEVLKNDGRVVMSIGQPLYSGHLVMLAGFDENGDPLVHDPAKINGKYYHFNKTDLSKAWFDKGGIAYTFYKEDIKTSNNYQKISNKTFSNYPNPVLNQTVFQFKLETASEISLIIYSIDGKLIATPAQGTYPSGINYVKWERTSDLPPSVYIAKLKTSTGIQQRKIILQ